MSGKDSSRNSANSSNLNCNKCQKSIYANDPRVGPISGDVYYHKKCFNCKFCGITLTINTYKYVKEESKVVCKIDCNNKNRDSSCCGDALTPSVARRFFEEASRNESNENKVEPNDNLNECVNNIEISSKDANEKAEPKDNDKDSLNDNDSVFEVVKEAQNNDNKNIFTGENNSKTDEIVEPNVDNKDTTKENSEFSEVNSLPNNNNNSITDNENDKDKKSLFDQSSQISRQSSNENSNSTVEQREIDAQSDEINQEKSTNFGNFITNTVAAGFNNSKNENEGALAQLISNVHNFIPEKKLLHENLGVFIVTVRYVVSDLKGNLFIILHGATNLKQLNDYDLHLAELTLWFNQTKIEPVRNTKSKNEPTWDETFKYDNIEDEFENLKLVIKDYRKSSNLLKNDKKLVGEAKIQLTELRDRNTIERREYTIETSNDE